MVVQILDIRIYDEIGIEIQHFIVVWQYSLNKESVIGFSADVRVSFELMVFDII